MYWDKGKQKWIYHHYVKYACGYCGESYDTIEEALKCCEAEWDADNPAYYNKVTSCCNADIVTKQIPEYPLGPGQGYYLLEVNVCEKCGEEVDEDEDE